MFFRFAGRRRNQPVEVASENPVPRVLAWGTGDAGRDGYSSISTADRETGIRRPAGTPVYEGPRQED